jgi:HAD superfamily hydrolase (TIGR01509 family)
LSRAGLAAALFDLDGLLVDSEPAWTVAERTAFEALGGTWSPAIKAACVGRRLDDMAAELVRLSGAASAPLAVAAALDAHVADLFARGLPPRPGALALLDALAAARVPLALVSSTRRPLVELALRAIGPERFAVVVTGGDVARPKPDPEPYLLAAARLGAEPARCVVFEDSPAGVRAGLAAGCAVVAVPSSVPVEAEPGVTVVPSLADVDVAALVAGCLSSRPAAAAG